MANKINTKYIINNRNAHGSSIALNFNHEMKGFA